MNKSNNLACGESLKKNITFFSPPGILAFFDTKARFRGRVLEVRWWGVEPAVGPRGAGAGQELLPLQRSELHCPRGEVVRSRASSRSQGGRSRTGALATSEVGLELEGTFQWSNWSWRLEWMFYARDKGPLNSLHTDLCVPIHSTQPTNR